LAQLSNIYEGYVSTLEALVEKSRQYELGTAAKTFKE
jgi:hypothetical protein